VYKDDPAIFELGPSPVVERPTLVTPQLADKSYLWMTYEDLELISIITKI